MAIHCEWLMLLIDIIGLVMEGIRNGPDLILCAYMHIHQTYME